MEDILRELNLKDKEILIYGCLLKRGPQPASLIARYLGMNRSSLYLTLEKMVLMGIISVLPKNGLQIFIPTPAYNLLNMVKKKQRSIDKKIRAAEEEILNLQRIKDSTPPTPKIHYYQGDIGLIQLLDNILLSRPQTVQAFIAGRFFDFIESKFKDFPKKRVEKNISAMIIHPSDDCEYGWKSDLTFRRETRFVSTKYDKGLDVISYGNNKTILIAADEHFAISVESVLFRQIQNSVFNSFWINAKLL